MTVLKLTISKKDRDYLQTVCIRKDSKVRALNDRKPKRAKYLKIGDVLKGNWTILDIEPEQLYRPKTKTVQITNNLQQLVQLLKDRFGSKDWDFSKVQTLLNKYNITDIHPVFSGLLIENVFEDLIYVPGEVMVGDYYLNKITDVDNTFIEDLDLI